jgi:hypothetical protein
MIAEFAAVKARLLAHSVLQDLGVFDTARTDDSGELVRDQYTILYGGPADTLDDERLAGVQTVDSDAEYFYPVRSVAVTADGARDIASLVQTQLIGFVPVIVSRRCYAMTLDDVSAAEPDFSVNPPLFYVDQTFRLKSDRA